jgi:hypothetical protein
MDVIRREEIPNWDYGDVCIKHYSFGDKIKLSSMAMTVKVDSKTMTEQMTAKEIDTEEMILLAVAAGISWVKKKDNYEFLFKPDRKTSDLVEFIRQINYDSGVFLKNKIAVINQAMTDQEIKN